MNGLDDTTVRQWIDLEADGCLPAADRQRLQAVLTEKPAYRQELEELRRLHAALAADRVEVKADFRARVMESLPVAAWESGGSQRWGLAVAATVALAVVSTVLLGLGGAVRDSGPVLGIVSAVGQALQASLLTGAGLLGASWRGVGLALGELLTVSPLTTVVFGVAVLALNLLFFRLLRRGARTPQPAGRSDRSSGSSERRS